jgi:hypothetical protein
LQIAIKALCALLVGILSLKTFKVPNHIVGTSRPIGILDPVKVLQGLWPCLGQVALLRSLILMKYFKVCGLFGACRPIGIFDPDEVLQGLWPVWGMSLYWDL